MYNCQTWLDERMHFETLDMQQQTFLQLMIWLYDRLMNECPTTWSSFISPDSPIRIVESGVTILTGPYEPGSWVQTQGPYPRLTGREEKWPELRGAEKVLPGYNITNK